MSVISFDRMLNWVVQTSWQASVLVMLILVAQFALRNRLSPAWRHGLWLLLVVRLVLPATPPSAYSIFNLTPTKAFTPAPQPSFVAQDVEAAPPLKTIAESLPTQMVVETATPARPDSSRVEPKLKEAPGFIWSWSAAGKLLWVFGFCYFALRLIWSNFRFSVRLKRSQPTSNERLISDFAPCKEILRYRGEIVLIETDEVTSPAVYGFWRKKLLLPSGTAERFSSAEMRHIFLHELAHVVRRDVEVNWLIGALQAIHWFNPLLWYAFQRMRADRELATDALVLSKIEREETSLYGETILRLVEWISRAGRVPSLVGIVEQKKDIESRIRMIAAFGRRKYWTLLAVVVLALLAVCVCTDMRVRAATERSDSSIDPLGESLADGKSRKLITALKQKSRWTLGPAAVLFGDEDGEVSGGFVRNVQIRNYAMSPEAIQVLGEATATAIPATPGSTEWTFTHDLRSADGKTILKPMASGAGQEAAFEFVEQDIAGERVPVLHFGAGTYFSFENPFRDASGQPYITDYTVIMDVMFPSMPSRWAALFQTDASNKSDAEWFISSEKGLGITDNYGGHVSTGEWHRLVLRLEGSIARFTSYVDGHQVQRKELDVQDEFYNRRRDEDVIAWTKLLTQLRNQKNASAGIALQKFSIRLENGENRARTTALPTPNLRARVVESRPMLVAALERAASMPTSELIRTLAAKSRWTLGPEALLFADENGENAGGFVNALQVRGYAMPDKEVAALGSASRELPALRGNGQVAQWDFNGDLNSSTGAEPLIAERCGPAPEPEVAFTPYAADSRANEVARFSRGTMFVVPIPFAEPQNAGWLLNYSVVLDVKFDERPVGWASLWQNDPANRTDADWFINKKQELGIRDLYGGMIDDGEWHRLALVVDGRSGIISHFVDGKKVRSKRMIMEDDYSRRGGAERSLDVMLANISELERRREPEAAEMLTVFARRMHNRPDPEAEYSSVPVKVQVLNARTAKGLAGARVYYQMGESNEDFIPESVITDQQGIARIEAHMPVAAALHITAWATGFAPANATIAAADLVKSPGTELQLPLLQSQTVGGRIVDANGAAVPGGLLRVGSENTSGRLVPSWKAAVPISPDGTWQTDQIAAGETSIEVDFESSLYSPTIILLKSGDPGFDDLKNRGAVIRLEE